MLLPFDDTLYRIQKADDDRRLVFGFASVITKNGNPIIDRQGDVLMDTELQDGAHGYMLLGRGGKVSHAGAHVADPVESMVVTKQSSFPTLLKALDIPMPDELPIEGWWVGFRVNDDGVWNRVKKGDLKSFSIGGTGYRTPLEN